MMEDVLLRLRKERRMTVAAFVVAVVVVAAIQGLFASPHRAPVETAPIAVEASQ